MGSLLERDLQAVFGSVFSPLLLDVTITKPVLVANGSGGFTEGTPDESAGKGMVERYSEYERAEFNIPATDVRLILLQSGVTVDPDTDSTVTIRGQVYSIQSIDKDPANASWTMRVRLIVPNDADDPVLSGLLGGDLKEVFGSVFSPLLIDATLTVVTLTPDGAGGMSESTETSAIKCMMESYSEHTRILANIPRTDVKIIALQQDVTVTPTVDARITMQGVTYSVQAVDEDPAQASWIIRGRAIHTGVSAGPVSIDASADVVVAAGTPRLTLVVNNPADVVVDAGSLTTEIDISAPASAVVDAGSGILRTVPIDQPAAAVVDAGAALGVGVPISAPVDTVVDAEAPPYGVQVSAPAGVTVDASAGASVAVVVSGEAGTVVEAGANSQVSVPLSGAAGVVVDAASAISMGGVTIDAPADVVVDAGTTEVSVAVSAATGVVVDSPASASVAVQIGASAAAAVDAGSAAQVSVAAAGAADVVVSAGVGSSVTVPVSGSAAANVDAGVGVQREVPVSAAAAALVDAEAATERTVNVSGNAQAVVAAAANVDVTAGGNEAETDALIARMTTAPDATREGHINDLVAALKTAGVWSKLGVLYVYAAHTSQAALLNWVDDGTLDGVNNNSMTFTTDEGFKGGATNANIQIGSSGLNLGALPSGFPMALQDAHVGMYYFDLATSGTRDLRTDTNTIWMRSDISRPYGPITGGSNFAQSSKTGVTSIHTVYDHYTDFRRLYYDGSQYNTQAASGGAMSGYLTAGGRVDGTTNAEFSIFHVGSHLTATEISDMYDAFNAYLTAIGTI